MSHLVKSVVLSYTLLFFPGGIYCQHHQAVIDANHNHNFEQLSIQDGLSHNSVRCILQDNRGFVWIGTDDGLNRFDGVEFKIYKSGQQNSHGLTNNRIKCLYQDRNGFLWIGTVSGGLHRFNTTTESFENWSYDAENPNSLSSNNVTALVEDDSGTIWIGTVGGGLNALRPASNSNVRYQHRPEDSSSLSSNDVRALCLDEKGRLWIGTDAGLDLFDQAQQSFIHQKFKTGHDFVGNLAVGAISADLNGTLWLGTANGLLNFDPVTAASQIWLPDPTMSFESEKNRITTIESDIKNNLWIGTLSQGLFLVDKENRKSVRLWQKEGTEHSGTSSVTCIQEDRSGIVWVGSYDGVYKFTPGQPKFHDFQEKLGSGRLTSNYTWPIYEDRQGILWFGTMAGLNSYDPETGKINQYIHDAANPASLSNNAVISIFEDSGGDLWIGTFAGGLNRLNRKTALFQHWKVDPNDPESLPNNLVGCIYQDRSGKIWIGSGRGLVFFEHSNNRALRYKNQEGREILQGQYISDIHEDRHGNFWIATLQGGLIRLDRQQGTFRQWHHDPENPNSPGSNALGDIIELPDSKDTTKFILWLGSEGGGLIRFDPETEQFRSFTIDEGLADNKISCLVADHAGIIWLSTDKGLTRFNPETGSCRTYDRRDGLPDEVFNTWAGLSSRSGELYFGTQTGIIYFNPADFAEDEKAEPPPVVITDLQIFNQPVHIGKDSPLQRSITETHTLKLSYREYIFSIKFAALDFVRPEQNRYAYQLDGISDDWIEIGARHRVDFTGLSPGKYTFQVKAANSRGIWNDAGARLKIIISPPFWKSSWAYLIYFLLIVTGLFALRQREITRVKREDEIRILREREAAALRETQLRTEAAEAEKELEKHQMRTRIASDLHDEIGSNLSSITLLSHMMQNRKDFPEEIREAFLDVNKAAKVSTEAIREIVWFINPNSDNLGDLISRLNETATSMLPGYDILFRQPEGFESQKLHPEIKRNIYLVYKEILTNIIRHAQASQIEISVHLKEGDFRLAVADNGVGFNPETISRGNGLNNLEYRASHIGGKIEITSGSGKGTRISLALNIT